MNTEKTVLRIREGDPAWGINVEFYVCTAEPSQSHWPHLYASASRERAEQYARAVVASFPERYDLEGVRI